MSVVAPAFTLGSEKVLCTTPGWDAVETETKLSLELRASGADVSFTGELGGDRFDFISAWFFADTLPDPVEYTSPVVNSLAAVGGTSVTVTGLGFSSHSSVEHWCKFTCPGGLGDACPDGGQVNVSATYIDSGKLKCAAPAWPYGDSLSSGAARVIFTVVTLGGEYDLRYTGASPLEMTYTRAWWRSSGSVYSGGATGGQVITMTGDDFCYRKAQSSCDNVYKCRFAQLFTNRDRHAYSQQCAGGLKDGDACMVDSDCGTGFQCSQSVTFFSTASQIMSNNQIRCVVPSWVYPGAIAGISVWDFTISTEGQLLGAIGGQATFEFLSFINSALPWYVPATVDTNITVQGVGFDSDASDYLCSFLLYNRSVPVTIEEKRPYLVKPLSNQIIECKVPPWFRDVAAGPSQLTVQRIDLDNDRILSTAAPSIPGGINVTYYPLWYGFGTCDMLNIMDCFPTR